MCGDLLYNENDVSNPAGPIHITKTSSPQLHQHHQPDMQIAANVIALAASPEVRKEEVRDEEPM